MLVHDRERVRYDADYNDYAYERRNDRFACYDYESRYEDDRNRTSDSYRDSLMSSLERPAVRSRLERSDADRYGFYRSNLDVAENNYDKFWDSKRSGRCDVREETPKKSRGKALIVAYLTLAVVAIIAVTLSIVGFGQKEDVRVTTLKVEEVSASAEEAENEAIMNESVASQEESAISEENYILLSTGEKIALDIPQQEEKPIEEEKGFDKFCSWLNGVFGG